MSIRCQKILFELIPDGPSCKLEEITGVQVLKCQHETIYGVPGYLVLIESTKMEETIDFLGQHGWDSRRLS
jgi:hypothetical protein